MLNLKKYLVLLLLFLFSSLFFKLNTLAVTYDKILATINKESITQVMLDTAIKQMQSTLQSGNFKNQDLSTIRIIVAKKLLDDMLLNTEANVLQVESTESEIENELKVFKESNNLDDVSFNKLLDTYGYSFSIFKKYLGEQASRRQIINRFVRFNIRVDDANLREYYNENFNFNRLRYDLRIYSIRFENPSNFESTKLVASTMTEYYNKLESKELDLENFKNFFAGKGDVQVGDSSFFIEDLEDDFKKALTGKEIGQYTKPIQVSNGIYILYLKDIEQTEPLTFDDQKQQVTIAYYEQEFNKYYAEYIKSLADKYQVNYLDQNFRRLIDNYYDDPAQYSLSYLQ